MFACLHASGNLALLLECAEHFSPFIEETAPDTVVFNVHGLRRIHGTAKETAAAIEQRVGICANLALASSWLSRS